MTKKLVIKCDSPACGVDIEDGKTMISVSRLVVFAPNSASADEQVIISDGDYCSRACLRLAIGLMYDELGLDGSDE